MARTKISEFSATAADNTDIDNIDIAEGCAPSGINNAIRELMAQLKDMQTGASGDTFTLTTVNSTTVDTTNLEVSNLKAKDGTAAGSIADSTGVVTLTSLSGTTANITNVNATTLDATNVEVTNIKAKDGTASASIADSTGVFTHATNTVFPAGAVGTPSITTAGDINTGVFFPAADTIAFSEGGVEAMRINSSGNVGIGTSSPTQKLSVTGSINVPAGNQIIAGGTSIYNDGSIGQPSLQMNSFTGVAVGSVSIGDSTGDQGHIIFRNPNGSVGSITTLGSSTFYNSVSDYRLKENVLPLTGALTTIASLKPCTYKWKVDGSSGQGFIAHELQEVVPECVSGTKDAVDKDGNNKYQSVDTSYLVATLVAAIQELKTEFDVYKANHP